MVHQPSITLAFYIMDLAVGVVHIHFKSQILILSITGGRTSSTHLAVYGPVLHYCAL